MISLLLQKFLELLVLLPFYKLFNNYYVIVGFPGCGGTYTMEHGDIQAPTQDGQYLPNLICEYKIKLADNSRIKVTFTSFSLEVADNCLADSLSVSN